MAISQTKTHLMLFTQHLEQIHSNMIQSQITIFTQSHTFVYRRTGVSLYSIYSSYILLHFVKME